MIHNHNRHTRFRRSTDCFFFVLLWRRFKIFFNLLIRIKIKYTTPLFPLSRGEGPDFVAADLDGLEDQTTFDFNKI